MVRGFLQKFQTTEEGVSILVKASDDQINEIAALHKKAIVLSDAQAKLPGMPTPSDTAAHEIARIKTILDKILVELQTPMHEEETSGREGEPEV